MTPEPTGPRPARLRRSSRIRTAVLVVAALCVSAGGFTAFWQIPLSIRWDEVEAWVAEHESALAPAPIERPVLFGEVFAEDAAPHYARAEELARPIVNARDRDLVDVWAERGIGTKTHDAETRAHHDELLASLAPALAALRRGAHCATYTPPAIDLEPSVENGQIANLLVGRWLANACCIEAAACLSAGDDLGAVAWTLDAASYGSDVARRVALIDQMIGNALVAIPTAEFWTDERLAELDATALDRLADGLEALDARHALTPRLEAELVYFARVVMDPDEHVELLPEAFTAEGVVPWMQRLFPRLLAVHAVEEMRGSFERIEALREEQWPMRQKILELETTRLRKSDNPLLQVTTATLSMESGLRTVAAKLRMLRIAVDLHRGSTPPRIDDPFGTDALRVEVENGRFLVASSGGDRSEHLTRTVTARPSPR
jgi:hypothetical protein